MFSTASHTPEADLYEDRNGAVPPTAETLAPILGRDVETVAAASHNVAIAHLETWSTNKGQKFFQDSHVTISLNNINEPRVHEV